MPMNKARIIRQSPVVTEGLPDFRNLGVQWRILLACTGTALVMALLMAERWQAVVPHLVQGALWQGPALLTSLLLLWGLQPWLQTQTHRRAIALVLALNAGTALAVFHAARGLIHPDGEGDALFDSMRLLVAVVCLSGALLVYFQARNRALSQALEETRLRVLSARIRPHFLFNTLNAVLGIVRQQPARAETALEDLSDLFRMAMSEPNERVPLSRELALCRQYLALEQLRMGERLKVDWRVPEDVLSLLIPPLLLQPLLENAVYHGVERLPQGGTIGIDIARQGAALRIRLQNPLPARSEGGNPGNRMALQNIRARLALLYDTEAQYEVKEEDLMYRVEMRLPAEKVHG